MFKKRKKSKEKMHIDKEFDRKEIYSTLEDNIEYIKKQYHETDDLHIRYILHNNQKGVVIYIETICDSDKIQQGLLIPLALRSEEPLETLITIPDLKKTIYLNIALNELNKGISLLLFENEEKIYMFNTIMNSNRSPDEPPNEKVIRGSHDGFVESLTINLNLIRKRIRSCQLTVKYKKIGTESNNQIAIVYMADLVDSELLQEVDGRLKSVSTDTVSSTGFIQEFIEDKPFSPFPQILNTERPDRVMAHLLEGRIALIADGSSEALIVPVTFFAFFQSPDDFNSRVFSGSLFRLLRLSNYLISVTFPAFYIATIGFHYEIIPKEIIIIVKSSVEGIPFPPLIEAIIMGITIELIREAGIRLPTPIGQTIGIVGGLIIGDAVINAGLISNIMVIIIAITAISSFTIPNYEMSTSVRLLTYPLMLTAASLGFVGIIFSFMYLVTHLCKLESFGKPYFAPLAPLRIANLKDSFVRFPNWMLNKRPLDASPKKVKRQNKNREQDENDF